MEIDKLIDAINKYIANDPTEIAGAKAILQVSSTAKLLIIGQAPGIRAHTTGIPWNDPSGNRLRAWLNITREEFYDKNKIAILPIGFSFPGVNKYGGDKPPTGKHALLWHERLLTLMPDIKLTLLIGTYAQKYYLKSSMKKSLTETISAWREYLPDYIVLPHPSWHNTQLIKKHAWFEEELLPYLQKEVRKILG